MDERLNGERDAQALTRDAGAVTRGTVGAVPTAMLAAVVWLWGCVG